MEHFLIPWSFLRVRSDNIRYPLNLCSFGVGTIPPVPHFLRLSWFLTTYTSLVANVFLAAHAITACTLSTMGAPLPYRSPFLSIDLLQAIPCFQLGRNAMHLGSPFTLSRRSSAVGWGG